MKEEIFTTDQYNLINEIVDNNGIPRCTLYESSDQALALEAALEHTAFSVYHNTKPVPLYVINFGSRKPRWVGYVNVNDKPCLVLSKPMTWIKMAGIAAGVEEIEWDGKRTVDLTSPRSTHNGEGIAYGNIVNTLELLTNRQVVADESIWYKGAN